MNKTVLAVIGLLITYGSLYPFNVVAPSPEAWSTLWHSATLWTSRGDVLGNVLLFLPWGWVGAQAFRGSARWRVVATLSSGALLAVLIQLAQLWVPSRDAALGDAAWNLLGAALALALARFFPVPAAGAAANSTSRGTSRHALVLMAAWVLVETLPWVPSLDASLLFEQGRRLMATDSLDLGEMVLSFSMALWVAHLIRSQWPPSQATTLYLLLLPAVLAVKLVIVQAPVDPAHMAGLALGMLLGPTLAHPAHVTPARLALALLLGLTLAELAPFSFMSEAQPIQWLPFAALLEGDMLNNLRSLLADGIVYLAILYTVQSIAGRATAFALALALWVGILEAIQALLPGRTPDMTAPLLVLVAAWICHHAPLPAIRGKPAPAPVDGTSVKPSPASAKPWQAWVLPGVSALLIAGAMHTLLRLPGLPYNIRELFRHDGSGIDLLAFSAALLWAGGGAAWLSHRVRHSPRPYLSVPLLGFGLCLSTLLLLWSAVSTESIEDIAGSNNLFWFVTNKDIWGSGWRTVFLWLDAPELIGFLEHCVRFAALYAPVPLTVMSLLLLLDAKAIARPVTWWLQLALATALTLWLSQKVAFSWSSTDNLNELLSKRGPWGLRSGGIWLYGLLLLMGLSGLLLARARTLAQGFGLFMGTVMLVPLGWTLLNWGLDPAVQKYGLEFSAIQFLLGANRSDLLAREWLFLRWSLVQTAAVALLALGLVCARPFLKARPRQAPSTAA